MRERQLTIFWIALVVVFTVTLIGLLQYSRSLATRSVTAAAEVARLKAAIAQKEQETLVEMRSNSAILQEMSWTGTTGDPVAFLSRVADLAQGSRLRVLAVGPLVMRHLFGQHFTYGRFGLALVGLGMGLHLIAGALNQAALARDQARHAAMCWLGAASLFMVWMLLPLIGDQLLRVEVGYPGATAALALALWLLYRRRAASP